MKLFCRRIALLLCVSALSFVPFATSASTVVGHANTTTLTNGLIDYWPMDGWTINWSKNQVNDLSGNGNTATIVGMSTTTSSVVGKFGQTLNFKTAGQYLTSTISTPVATYSVAAWVRYQGTVPISSSPRVAVGYGAGGDAHTLWMGYANNGLLAISNSSMDLTDSAVSNSTSWHFLVASVQNGTLTAYADGVAYASESIGSRAANTLVVGDYIGLGFAFNGLVDDVRVYNRALSAQEVAQLYATGVLRAGNAPAPTASSVGLASGLVGYWPFDGDTTNWTSNTTRDLSGSGGTGTLVSMSTTTSPVVGKIGQAFSLNGSSQYVQITPIPNALGVGGTPTLSVSAWVKRGSTSATGGIVNYASQYTFAIGVTPCTTNQVKLTKYNVVDICIGTFPSDTKFHLLTAVWSSSGVKLYIDGVLNATSADTSNFSGSTGGVFAIGYASNDGVYFNGTIDDVRVYNRTLSYQEIQQLYAAGQVNVGHSSATALGNGLVGYWTFDGGSMNWKSNTVADVSGSGNTGTLVSMSTTTSPVIGKIGQAISFNGSTSYVDLGNGSSVNISGPMTVSTWVKFTVAPGGNSRIISKDNVLGATGYILSPNSSMTPRFLLGNGASFVNATAGSSMVVGQWYLLTGVWDGSKIYIYVNGALSGSNTDSSFSPDASDHLEIGQDTSQPGTGMFAGAIDDARVYNRALTAQEVQQLYATGR